MSYLGKSANIVQNYNCGTSSSPGFLHEGKKKSQQP